MMVVVAVGVWVGVVKEKKNLLQVFSSCKSTTCLETII